LKYYRLGQKVSPAQVGGKAANLSWLHKNGYPVPYAVFLPVVALESHLRFNRLQADAGYLSKEAGHLAEEELSGRLEQMRAKILQGQLSRDIREMATEIGNLFSGTVAVRSSAGDEDSAQHSFAGQYATILDVAAQPQPLTQALLSVWASAWDERVVRYRLKNDLPFNSGLGVIVQRMLHPQLAGVAFSVQPGDLEERYGLIEFVRGLGEQLVDGSQTPQRLVFDREKRLWKNPEEIPAEYSQAFGRLLSFVLQIERQSGQPVDVEWAMESPEKLYLLQMRPVTAQAQGTLWTQENVGEVMPDVVTPFSWSVLKPVVNQAYEYFLKSVGVADYPQDGLFALYQGRVYFNHSAFRQVMNYFYFSRNGGRPKMAKLAALFPKALRSMCFFCRLPRKIKNYLKNYNQRLAPIKFDESIATPQLFERMDELIGLHRRTMALHIAGTIAGELYYQLLDKLARRWLVNAGLSADELLGGAAPVASSQSAKFLAGMAGRIRQNSSLKKQILQMEWTQAQEALRQTSEGKHLLQELDDFFERYGHGALHEFELYYPRWREEPAYIWRNLQNYLKNERMLPTETTRKQADSVNRWAGAGLIKKIVLKHIFIKTKFYNIYREELKQAFLKAHSELKKYLLAVGRDLVRQGKIEQALDALFFSREELEDNIVKDVPLNLPRERAAERQRQRQRFERVPHPAKVRQTGDEWIPLNEDEDASAAELKGLPCSAGVVRGRVKIVLRPENFTSLAKGEILVAPATNPGWAPLMMSAAAVVTEIGGALSHGAIIAREFGIPMIAAVPNITHRLEDGQLIEVNGSTGIITILDT